MRPVTFSPEEKDVRLAFLLVLLAGAIFYTYVAFMDLSFMTRSGRLGPGFFPRIVGVAAVFFVGWTVLDALRDREALLVDGANRRWSDAFLLIGLAIGYAVLLRLFGGFPATVMYLALALSILNRGRYLQNGILALAIPSGVYLLFDQFLNANMPPALFDLTF
jgi:hypothetical protein